MVTKKTKTAKRRTETKEIPKSQKDLKGDTLKKVKGGRKPDRAEWDVSTNKGG